MGSTPGPVVRPVTTVTVVETKTDLGGITVGPPLSVGSWGRGKSFLYTQVPPPTVQGPSLYLEKTLLSSGKKSSEERTPSRYPSKRGR